MVIWVGWAATGAVRRSSDSTIQAKSVIGLPSLGRAEHSAGRRSRATRNPPRYHADAIMTATPAAGPVARSLVTHWRPYEGRDPADRDRLRDGNSPIKFGLGAMDEIGFDAGRLGIRKA